jgi:hypothetical protein
MDAYLHAISMICYGMIYDMIYLTAIGLTPGGSSTVHIYTKTIHRQHNRHKPYTEQHNSLIRKSADRAPSFRGIPWHLPYNWGKSTENRRAECFKSIVHITSHKSTVGPFIGWDVNKFCCCNLICLLPSCHLIPAPALTKLDSHGTVISRIKHM